MDIQQATAIVRQAVDNPLSTWQDYSPQHIPLVLYNEREFRTLNHPNPPAERPAQLTAATAVDINGERTATVPLELFPEETMFVPVTYHECFHVHQEQHFASPEEFNFFEVLAYYPEFDPAYRALCSAETDVINDPDLAPLQKAAFLAGLTAQRHALLSQKPGLLAFEQMLERKEGTAAYVEQKVRQSLYGVSPKAQDTQYGYSRQYEMGAAICWLLDELDPTEAWKEAVADGAALTELLRRAAGQRADWDQQDLQEREIQERRLSAQVLEETNRRIQELFAGDVATIKLPDMTTVSRSFSPKSLVSLGDGRILHTEFVIIMAPYGQISIKNALALEDYTAGTITFAAPPPQIAAEGLHIETETCQVSLQGVRQLPDGGFEVNE